jgi:valyl-tRNA synthetase
MDKTFAPQDIETKWYKTWEDRGYFAPDMSEGGAGEPYSIIIPPPNVTGSLHIGHGCPDPIQPHEGQKCALASGY